MDKIAGDQTDPLNQQDALRNLEKAYQKLGSLIKDLKESQGTANFNQDLEFNLPVVMNYIGAATQNAQLQNQDKLISSLIPIYWRQTLRFPMEMHTLEEVWKSVWKCNLSSEELTILKQIELPDDEQDQKKKKKKKDKKKPKPKPKKENNDLDSDEELPDYTITLEQIVDEVYNNIEDELPFQGTLPGYTSDVYTKMDREKLEEYLKTFKKEDFNNQITEQDVKFNSVDTVYSKKEEYEQIIKDAYWQGPFFYGGSALPGYTYLSFATITKEGRFGGWWLVMWANGTMRLTQNISTEQVGKLITIA